METIVQHHCVVAAINNSNKISVATDNPIHDLMSIEKIDDDDSARMDTSDDDDDDDDAVSSASDDNDSVNEDDIDFFILEMDMTELSNRVQMMIGLQAGMYHRFEAKKRLCDLSAYNRIRTAVFDGLNELARMETIVQHKESQIWMAKQKKMAEKSVKIDTICCDAPTATHDVSTNVQPDQLMDYQNSN